MTDLDALLLSRLQFAFTIAWHIVFPSFTIGLASYLAVLEGLWLKTGRPVFQTLYLFWVKVFAISFGMAVVSGVVMSYQFGANWSVFRHAHRAGAGAPAGLRGADRLLPGGQLPGRHAVRLAARGGGGLHFTATCLVAFGTLISAFWILSANSWMQHPTGFAILADGRFIATDWLAVIFSPTFPVRFAHMVLAAFLTTALVVGAASAWQLLRRPEQAESRVAIRMSIGMFAVVATLQLFVGDASGKIVAEFQPSKLAAVEAFWETRAGQAFHIAAWPNRKAQRNDWEISIPKAAA